jgi:hypothetical protein
MVCYIQYCRYIIFFGGGGAFPILLYKQALTKNIISLLYSSSIANQSQISVISPHQCIPIFPTRFSRPLTSGALASIPFVIKLLIALRTGLCLLLKLRFRDKHLNRHPRLTGHVKVSVSGLILISWW